MCTYVPLLLWHKGAAPWDPRESLEGPGEGPTSTCRMTRGREGTKQPRSCPQLQGAGAASLQGRKWGGTAWPEPRRVHEVLPESGPGGRCLGRCLRSGPARDGAGHRPAVQEGSDSQGDSTRATVSVDEATLGGQGQPSRAPTALPSVCWRRRGLGAAGMSWRAGGESAEGILVEGSSSKVGGHTACLCAVRDPPIGGRKQVAGRPRIPL